RLERSDAGRMPGRVNQGPSRQEPMSQDRLNQDRLNHQSAIAASSGERPDTWGRLVEVPEFTMDVVELGGADSEGFISDATTAESLELLVLTRGEATVCGPDPRPQENAAGDADENCVSLRRSDAVLLPAALGPYTIRGRGEILR